jgi:hypothetical protein
VRGKLICAVLLIFAGASAAGRAMDATPQPAPSADRAYALIGLWNCVSNVGFAGTRSFGRDSSGAINMRYNFRLPSGDSTVVIEAYRFSASQGRWTATAGDSDYFGPMQVDGPVWNGDEWTFEGWQDRHARDETTVRDKVRVIYSGLETNAFARKQQVLVEGVWRTYFDESCKRSGTR